MDVLRAAVARLTIRWGFDTRARNLAAARAVQTALRARGVQTPARVLDVGSGTLGVSAFLPTVPVVGVDIIDPADVAPRPNFELRRGSVTALPFDDRSFPVVTCIDVLEHLPVDLRPQAAAEIVRVAANAVVVACPHGDAARACDERFRSELTARGRPVPDWIEEHLAQPYPTAEELKTWLERGARVAGRTFDSLETTYSEPQILSRIVRGAAVRSSVAYGVVNLALGAGLPLLPAPSAAGSYRTMLVGTFA